MKKTKDVLIIVILAAIAVRVLWYGLEPFVPIAIIGLAFIYLFGMLFRRSRRF